MLKTTNVEDLLKLNKELHWIAENINKDIFGENFNHMRLWEYLSAYNDILTTPYHNSAIMNIVDIGSCRSWFPHFLALKFPNSKVWVTDTMLPEDYYGKGKAPEYPKNLQYKQMFAEQTEVEFGKGNIDIITCMSVIEHVDKELDCYRSMLGALKSGGYLLMSTDINYVRPYNIVPQRAYNFKMLRQRFELICDLIKTIPPDIDVNDDNEQLQRLDDNRRLWETEIDPVLKSTFEFNEILYLAGYWKLTRF